MNKKFILSAVLAIGILLTSCGRDEDPIVNINTPAPSAPETSMPSPPAEKPKDPTSERPHDSYISLRGYAQAWKVNPEIYLEKIDIVDLYNNPTNVKNHLKDLVTFAATEPNREKYYVLKDEDLKDLSIEDIQYNGNSISFKTTYKGVKSSITSSLNFSAKDYYERKITVNEAYVKSKYMRGSYENLFIGSLLNIDTNIYEAELSQNGNYKDDHQNMIRLDIELKDKRTNKTTSISKTITGFKTLKQLANELIIAHKYQLIEDFKNKISKSKDPNKINFTKDLEGLFSNKWKEYLTIGLLNGPLLFSYEKENILRGPSGYLDIYLERPIFVLRSAIINGNDLNIIIEFQQANDVSINKEYSLTIKNVK